ncbi:restriction endonuclease subunit S [Acinetobacter nectaris]|uniref:restriction endonuclease subunit S n=1 Tax=Acinetobacter nectaris TaxID=1219382 RepID=UPI001F00E1BF|nr:restriction endonuclease subunit S [Acinetobacter nectaris]
MIETPLFEICRPKQWKTISSKYLSENGYPVYGANGIIGFHSGYNHEKPTILITCRGATCGTINVSVPFSYINGNAMALDDLDEHKAYINYISYYLKYRGFADVISGAAQPQITREGLQSVKIPLPPLTEQRRIAAILDKADELRQKRKQAIEKLDQLLQATFIEMFGDPVTNPKGWDLFKLSDLGKISTGSTPSRSEPQNYGNYLEWIKSDNLNNNEDYATTATEYLSEKGAQKGRIAPKGSILVTCIAGSFDCIGNLAMVDRQVSFNQQINAITPNCSVLLEFLYYLMKISKPIIQNASTKGMKGMVSKSKFSEILLPVPPKEEQFQFVQFFKNFDSLKRSHKVFFNDVDSLFNSLQNQAFNGKL